MAADGDYNGVQITEAYLGKDFQERDAAFVTFRLPDGTSAKWNGSFDGEWLERTVNALRRCGWTGNNVATIDSVIGKKADISLKSKPGKKAGSMYQNVYINPPRRMLESEAAKGLAFSLERAIAAVGHPEEDEPVSAAPAPKQGGPTQQKMGIPDDDVPF